MTTISNLHFVTLFVLLAIFAVMLAVPQSANAMNKAELVESIASKEGLSKADSKKALEGFTHAPTHILEKGDRISLIGFGSFSISKRSARTGRNPMIGHGGGPDSETEATQAQDYNSTRSNKPGSVRDEDSDDDGSFDSGENVAPVKDYNAARSNKPSTARTGRNPQTGKEIQIAAKNVVKFKAGAELSKAVN